MAALAATLTGRVLIQIGDGEPVEVGTVEIQIHVGTARPSVTREAAPAERVIIAASSKARADDMARAHGINPVAIVTPRSPHGVRGMTADTVIYDDTLTQEQRDMLRAQATPALIAGRHPSV